MKYNILYVDGPPKDGLTTLNFESFTYGLEQSTVHTDEYDLKMIRTNYNVEETKQAVLKYMNALPNLNDLVNSNKFCIVVLASNQLFGAIEAVKEKDPTYLDKILIISSSGLGELPPGQNVSLLYSGNREIESLTIHQKIQKVEYAIMLYDDQNVYNLDFKRIYEEKNLLKETIYIPFNAAQSLDKAIDQLNALLKIASPAKLQRLEVILDCFVNDVNYIIPKLNYYPGYRVVTCAFGDNADPKEEDKRIPVMQTKVMPLDVTEALVQFRTYMLKYPKVPSEFAPGYFDAAVQLGQMMKEGMQLNVVNFCNRLTLYYFKKSVQYAGAWLDRIERRNLNANYGYIYTYDPIMDNRNKVRRYYQRSPWMPVLPQSASMPYYITNAFWVEPKQWLVYYSAWRLFSEINIPERFLKLYLGMDKSDFIESKRGYEFTITGYASEILSIYFTRKDPEDTKENIILNIPADKEEIFQYPFNVVKRVN